MAFLFSPAVLTLTQTTDFQEYKWHTLAATTLQVETSMLRISDGVGDGTGDGLGILLDSRRMQITFDWHNN